MDSTGGTITAAVFWLSLSILVYTYIGYPVLLMLRRRWRHCPVSKDVNYTTEISILIVAYNEEKVIRDKLENTLRLEYPKDRMEIIVASDGSTDLTNHIVRTFDDRGVKLLAYPHRRGKAQTLNDAIGHCRGNVVVLSDARQLYDSRAVKELVANFHDPTMGAVTGELQFHALPESGRNEGLGLYWRYEQWIRRLQSEADSTPVVTGAIYAIRRHLYRPLPETVIADDLAIPMSVIMQGLRVVCDPAAKAYDRPTRTRGQEFHKRVRTIAGSYQYLMLRVDVLNPITNRIWWDFVSHKVCRILAPFVMLALVIANLALPGSFYGVLLALQGVFYAMAVAGAILVDRGVALRLLSVPYTFLLLNAAACVALIKVAMGTQTNLWEKR